MPPGTDNGLPARIIPTCPKSAFSTPRLFGPSRPKPLPWSQTPKLAPKAPRRSREPSGNYSNTGFEGFLHEESYVCFGRRASTLGSKSTLWGRYLVFWYLDPWSLVSYDRSSCGRFSHTGPQPVVVILMVESLHELI